MPSLLTVRCVGLHDQKKSSPSVTARPGATLYTSASTFPYANIYGTLPGQRIGVINYLIAWTNEPVSEYYLSVLRMQGPPVAAAAAAAGAP